MGHLKKLKFSIKDLFIKCEQMRMDICLRVFLFRLRNAYLFTFKNKIYNGKLHFLYSVYLLKLIMSSCFPKNSNCSHKLYSKPM